MNRQEFEERAAIMEYDGGLSRVEAERRANEFSRRRENQNKRLGGMHSASTVSEEHAPETILIYPPADKSDFQSPRRSTGAATPQGHQHCTAARQPRPHGLRTYFST